ncbi:MAG: tetratricopeptide repeat protein [Cyanobacteria bacterium J06626_6]
MLSSRFLSLRFLITKTSVLQATQRACFVGMVALSIFQASVSAAPTGKTFEQLMDVGYAASRQGDFNTALINFRRALELRPNHPYASAAADNMTFYIEHARITRRQHAIDQLETRLTRAIEAKDWVCAATTLDQLTMYTAPNSLNRERLVGQRGEVSGLLDARLNHDAWSTVCAAQRPVH